jgi:hypothetical protein
MKGLGAVLVYVVVASAAAGAEKPPQGAANAALRYWMAFALMENPPADGDLAKKLAAVAEGPSAWDPSLGSIVDRNGEAISTMQRGTRLPDCIWGYEHELMAEAPIANLPRARALARLNVLSGKRLVSQGRSSEAIDAWLAGLRFSRDIAADGPWLAGLIAASALKSHLAALAEAVRDGKLDGPGRARIDKEITALPEAGFDWAVAARHESEGTSMILSAIEKADDPVARLQTYFPPDAKDEGARRVETARFIGVSPAQLDDREAIRAALRRARALNDALRPELLAAFAMRWNAAVPVVEGLDARAAQDPLLDKAWARTTRLNQSRGEVDQARAELLSLVRSR